MRLFPFKIFTLSKNKRLFNRNEKDRMIGIYDAEKLSYADAKKWSKIYRSDISILLGRVLNDISLICLDLDDCYLTNGELEDDTKEFLKEFDKSEWETSSSGTGIHIYILTKMDLNTFIVKDLEGCKSFECYTNKRHIVTTTFDFKNTNLEVGKHDKFLSNLYSRVEEKRSLKKDVIEVFEGKEIKDDIQMRMSYMSGRNPVTDMYTLRGLGKKDPCIIECIDCEPSSVDQSAWDAKLIRKLMYYTLSFDSAWELAKKTNYYKHKDKRHQDKFNSEAYKERTRRFIGG